METGNKIKPLHKLLNQEIYVKNADFLHLSIQINSSSIFFLIVDDNLNEFKIFLHFEFDKDFNSTQIAENIDQIILENKILGSNFKSTSISISNYMNCIVPKEYFDKNKVLDVLKFNHKIDFKLKEKYEFIEPINSYILFTVPFEIFTSLNSNYKNSVWKSSSEIFLTQLYKNKYIAKHNFFIYIEEEYIEIAFFEDSNLIFFNCFCYKTMNDIIYFLLNVFEKLNLKVHKNEINILGQVDLNSFIHVELDKIFHKVNFISRNKNINCKISTSIKLHKYYKIFNQHK